MAKKREKEENITINVAELQRDAKQVAAQRNSSVTKILAVNDIGSGAFGHAKERYLRACGKMEVEVEPNLPWGIITADIYKKICDIFGFDFNKYLVVTKEDEEEKEEEKEAPTIQNGNELQVEIQTLREAIQDIGRIATQSMMYLKKICEIWDK